MSLAESSLRRLLLQIRTGEGILARGGAVGTVWQAADCLCDIHPPLSYPQKLSLVQGSHALTHLCECNVNRSLPGKAIAFHIKRNKLR